MGGDPESLTDQAADAAFRTIEAKIEELGGDRRQVWAMAFVVLGGAGPANSTVAASFPVDVTPALMLEVAVQQLELVAAECGKRLVLTNAGN